MAIPSQAVSRLLEQLVPLAVGFTPLGRFDFDPARRRAGKVEADTPFADDALKALLRGSVQKFFAEKVCDSRSVWEMFEKRRAASG